MVTAKLRNRWGKCKPQAEKLTVAMAIDPIDTIDAIAPQPYGSPR